MTGAGLAPEGSALIGALTAASLLLVLAAILLARWPAWLAAMAVTAGAVLVAFLYRDPVRPTPPDPTAVVAPADGRIVAMDSVDEPSYMGGPVRRISVRSGLLDVHVIRSPADGVVDFVERDTGRTRVGISTGRIRVLIRHPGAMRVREGDLVDRAEPAGIAPLGGRLDLLVPLELTPTVGVGDRVRSGVSVVAMTGT